MNKSILSQVDKNLCLSSIRKLIFLMSKVITKSKNDMCITSRCNSRRKYKNRIFTLSFLKLNYFTRSIILGVTYSANIAGPIAQVLYTRRKSVAQIYTQNHGYR